MDSIRQRFLQADQDFLFAVHSNDDQLLADFAACWQILQYDWDSYSQNADPETQRLADSVAARVEGLAADIYAFESHRLSLEDDLLNGLEDVFASLTLNDDAIAPSDPTADLHRGTTTRDDTVCPAQWLLRNLHNPYPLPHVQFSTSRIAGSKHTKDWFSKARQRIGWTRLLRDRFAGCRSLATDAAFRAFVRDDPANPLDKDLKTAFLAMKSHAELVYGGEGATSPSSNRLRSISPTPSLTFSAGSEDSDDEQCPILSPENIFGRPTERACRDSPSRKRRRTHESPKCRESQSQTVAPRTCEEVPPPRPKKRRLSESDSDSSRPKRPRGIDGGRSHAVSDSLTSSIVPTLFDLDQSFQIPDPASTGPLDLSLFDLNFFNPPSIPSCTASYIPAPFPDIAVPASDLSALFEIPQLDLLHPGPQSFDSDWTEFLNFEPDLSLFSYPYSPTLSSASTPPFIDGAVPSPSFSSHDPPSPDPLLDILPHLNEKNIRIPGVGEPVIHEEDFLPPSENARITFATALLSAH